MKTTKREGFISEKPTGVLRLQQIKSVAHERMASFVLLTTEECYSRYVKNNRDVVSRGDDLYVAHALGIIPNSLSQISRSLPNKEIHYREILSFVNFW
jgi:hypothetical protein